MRLACTGIPDQQEVLALLKVFAAQQLPHQRFVDRGLGLEVEAVDGLGHRELRLLDPSLGGSPFPIDQLPLDQAQQVLRIAAPLLTAHRAHAGVVPQDRGQPQRLEVMLQQQQGRIFATHRPPPNNAP